MCGRFYLDADFDELLKHFKIRYEPQVVYEPRTLYPGQNPLTVISHKGQRRIGPMTWGYQTPFLKSPLINSRSETIFEKPSFKEAVLKRRCLIPASGFFEWPEQRKKQPPYRVFDPDRPLIAFAGIYTKFETPETQSWRFAIVTQDSVSPLSEIHPRSPVTLTEDLFDLWLNEQADVKSLKLVLDRKYETFVLKEDNLLSL